MILLYYNTTIADVAGCSLYFVSLRQVEGTHREQLMEIEVPEPQHMDVNDTPEQFQVGSWLVADFDGQYFVGQVRRAELNGAVLLSYLHQVVGRLNRYSWPVPEDSYETSLEDIFMPVVEAPCPTGGVKRKQWQMRVTRLLRRIIVS